MTALQQPLDTYAILEQMMLDYFVERRRALLTELSVVNRQLDKLRTEPTKAERERLAYELRQEQR